VAVLLGLGTGVLAGWFTVAGVAAAVMPALVLASAGWISWRRYRRVFTDDLPRELPGGPDDPGAAKGLRQVAAGARRERAAGRARWEG
jgi:hypothetical protein